MFEGHDWWAVKANGRQVPAPADVADLAAPGLVQLMASLLPPAPVAEPDMADLLAEAEARGRVQGHATGRAAALAELAPQQAAMVAAADAFAAALVIDDVALAPLLAGLVRQLCETVLAAELARPEALVPLAQAALALVQPDEPAMLAAHPDVLAALAPLLPGLAVTPDEQLPTDRVEVRAPQLVIAADATARLQQVLASLSGAA
jgi:flagellar biosynthesis/type III secretory pathway protein FliH